MIWGILTFGIGAIAVATVFFIPMYFIYQALRNNL